jgi:hypothetical protein
VKEDIGVELPCYRWSERPRELARQQPRLTKWPEQPVKVWKSAKKARRE